MTTFRAGEKVLVGGVRDVRTLDPARFRTERVDRFTARGASAMASSHVHYDDPACPHPGCGIGWVDWLQARTPAAMRKVLQPLVRSWWKGTGSSYGARPVKVGSVHDLGMGSCS